MNNFIKGVASVLQLFPPRRQNIKFKRRSPEDDAKNIENDFRKIIDWGEGEDYEFDEMLKDMNDYH